MLSLRRALLVISLAALSAGLAAKASALSLNIDFGGHELGGQSSSAYGAASGQIGTWNRIADLGLTGLLDLAGAPTAASVNVVASTSSGYGGGAPPVTDTDLLIKDNFYSVSGTSWSFAITGLAIGTYDIFIYAPDNSVVPTREFRVNGIAQPNLPGTPYSGGLVEGVNFSKLSGLSIVDGNLLVESDSNLGNGGVSGVQLVAVEVPEPTTLVLVAAGLLTTGLTRRKRGQAAR